MADNAIQTVDTGVIGWPVHHSRSPRIHNHWLKMHGLTGRYKAIPVPSDELPAFIASLRNGALRGCNVTIPHKEAVLALADTATDRAARIGAANTLWVADGQVHADNTDGEGFLTNLDAGAPGWDVLKGMALVIGAGGAARAIVDALAERGFAHILIANRTRERADALAQGCTTAEGIGMAEANTLSRQVDLLVNTTSLGMNDDVLSFDPSDLKPDCVVTDLVYAPLETPLLKAAKAQNLRTVDGLGMLLHQAVPGFERWYGVRPTVDSDLRTIVLGETP